MTSLFYAIFVAAVLVIIHWYIQNERMGANSDGSKGLLAMRAQRKPQTDNKPGIKRRNLRNATPEHMTPKSKRTQ